MAFRKSFFIGLAVTSLHVFVRHTLPVSVIVSENTGCETRGKRYIYGPFGKMIYSNKLPVITNFILFDRITAGGETIYSLRRLYIKYI